MGTCFGQNAILNKHTHTHTLSLHWLLDSVADDYNCYLLRLKNYWACQHPLIHHRKLSGSHYVLCFIPFLLETTEQLFQGLRLVYCTILCSWQSLVLLPCCLKDCRQWDELATAVHTHLLRDTKLWSKLSCAYMCKWEVCELESCRISVHVNHSTLILPYVKAEKSNTWAAGEIDQQAIM